MNGYQTVKVLTSTYVLPSIKKTLVYDPKRNAYVHPEIADSALVTFGNKKNGLVEVVLAGSENQIKGVMERLPN